MSLKPVPQQLPNPIPCHSQQPATDASHVSATADESPISPNIKSLSALCHTKARTKAQQQRKSTHEILSDPNTRPPHILQYARLHTSIRIIQRLRTGWPDHRTPLVFKHVRGRDFVGVGGRFGQLRFEVGFVCLPDRGRS